MGPPFPLGRNVRNDLSLAFPPPGANKSYMLGTPHRRQINVCARCGFRIRAGVKMGLTTSAAIPSWTDGEPVVDIVTPRLLTRAEGVPGSDP